MLKSVWHIAELREIFNSIPRRTDNIEGYYPSGTVQDKYGEYIYISDLIDKFPELQLDQVYDEKKEHRAGITLKPAYRLKTPQIDG